jgi:hypothetical protein
MAGVKQINNIFLNKNIQKFKNASKKIEY